jgi:hypothetical protein
MGLQVPARNSYERQRSAVLWVQHGGSVVYTAAAFLQRPRSPKTGRIKRERDMSSRREHATESPSPGRRSEVAHSHAGHKKPRPGIFRRTLSFFDSTTKALLAIGGLIAAATALWATLSHITSSRPTTPPSAAPTLGVPDFVIQPESCGALNYGVDGTAGPLLCPDGRPNLAADHWYRGYHLRVLELGPDASPGDVIDAICADFSNPHTRTSNPIESDAASLAQTEEQWHFPITFSDGISDASLCPNG